MEPELTVQAEDRVDYDETARLANEAFPAGRFTAEHLRWMYERCFSRGATVIALRSNGRKVGQFAILRQTVNADGIAEPAAQLVDLFVLRPYRSRAALAMLYGEVGRQCHAQGIRFAIGMPNKRAIAANEFFLGLKPHLWLDIRAGFALPGWTSPALLLHEPYARDRTEHYSHWFEAYEPLLVENGVAWRSEEICERLSTSRFSYGLHAVESLLLISSPRVRRTLPYTLYCGFFVRRGATVTHRDMRAVARSASKLWKRPLFIYPGLYKGLPQLPGWRLPKFVRPSTMLIQLRDFQAERGQLQWDRYQPIDFDLA